MKDPMLTTDTEVMQALEVLGAHFKWEEVHISIIREPAGVYSFSTYLPGDSAQGISYAFGHGNTAMEAVECIIKATEGQSRDPNVAIKEKIRELEQQIERLKRKGYQLPPYRRPGEIGYGVSAKEPTDPKPASTMTFDVEAKKDDIPF